MHRRIVSNKIKTIFLFIILLSQAMMFFSITASATGTVINDSGHTYGTSYNMERKVARTNNTWLHATYTKLVGGIREVYYARSQDNGSTWTNTAITTYAVDNGQFSPAILVDHHNHIWIAWCVEKASAPAYYNVSYVKSTNNGTTWSAISNIYSSSTIKCNNVTFASNNMGDVMFVFGGQITAISNYFPRYCRYDGVLHTFGAIGNLTIVGADCYTPTICSDYSNNFHLAYIVNNNVNYSKYSNATKTWGSIKKISSDTSVQQRPVMATNSTNGIHLVWYGIPNGDTGTRTRYSKSADGTTWSAPYNLTVAPALNAFTPSIAIDKANKIHVVWHQSIATRDILYRSSVDNGASWTAVSSIVSDATEDRYPILLWSTSPKYLTNYSGRPKTGYALIWTADNNIKYLSSVDLTWETLAPPAPVITPDYGPSINFSTDATTSGNKNTTNYIHANITSYGNASNPSDHRRHYTFLDFNRDVLLWATMDYYSGATLIDNSTWHNNGTLVGTATQNASGGRFGDSIDLDGNGDHISVPTSSSLDALDDTATISIWAKSDQDYTSFPNNARGLFGFYYDANNRLWVGIHKAEGKICIYDRLGGLAGYIYPSGVLAPNFIKQWHLYTFVFSSTTVSCYIDGVYNGSASFTGSMPGLGSLTDSFISYIGRGSTSSGTWDWYGDIDEYLVFNRELSLSQIKSLYNASANQYNYNFTVLNLGNYTYQGCSVNILGLTNQTETRWANISIQYPTTITSYSPANGSIDQDLYTTCSITIDDDNGGFVTVTWQDNSTGVWVTRHIDTLASSGDTLTYDFTSFTDLSTTYYWRVYLNDGLFNVSYIFHFTTSLHYFAITGLVNNSVDWYGLAGSSYWNNATGVSLETLGINISVGLAEEITDVGVWIGDMHIVHIDDFVTGWNINVSIPEWAIDSLQFDDPETVFESLGINVINITEEGTGLWWNRTGTPTLLHILPTMAYDVFANASCQLYIASDLQVNSSNVSIQFSADNITWGSNTRTFDDGGSEIFVNASVWTNANGCYGANPWGVPMTGVTEDIYCRFKLRLPIYLPSNYTYYSLSSIDWKINFYEANTTTSFLPLNLPATVPSSGYFTTKWNNVSLTFSGFSEPVADDINGDGYMEIFWEGTDSSSAPTIQVLACFNPMTGKAIWSNTTTLVTDIHAPLVIYDFDKDGSKELMRVNNEYAICYNALTGVEKWRTHLDTSGNVQHHFAYLDKGDKVYIYFATGDHTAPYDAKIDKILGTDGSIVASAPMYYSCYGGTTIADLDGNGKYEIIVTDRGQDNYPGTPAKSVRCYDEDLNLLWYGSGWNGASWVPGYSTVSSQCAKAIDINGDGKLEVIIGRQGGLGVDSMGLYIYNWDGSVYAYQDPLNTMRSHITSTVADVDGDGNYEYLDGYNSQPKIFDLTNWNIEYTIPVTVSEPPDVGNVILDPGPDDTYSEIIVSGGANTPIYKYNHTTHVYEFVTNVGVYSYFSVVADFDWDGYNEILLPGTRRMAMIETKVPATQPGPRVSMAFDGERRLNNGEAYSEPYSGQGLLGSISFGALSGIPGLSASVFVTSCTSQHSLVEYNGFYNKGNYTTYINTSLYLPSPWSLDTIYYRIKDSTGTVYENKTTGFTLTTVNSTYKRASLLYNPSTSMANTKICSVDVYAKIQYNGVVQFEGNKTFANVFTIYHIEPPYNGSSSYNTTLQSVNMTWTAGNYTNRYVVVRKSGTSYPTTPTDGTVVQNSTATVYNEASVTSSRAYSIFGYNSTSRSYSDPLNIPWGAVGTNCFNESRPSQSLTFNLEVTNQAGTIVYKRTGLHNTQYIDVQDIPYGTNTIFILESSGYKQRIYYKDITLNTFYNYSFYLPPDYTQGGGGGTNGSDTTDCTLRLITNSINVSSYTANVIVPLTHEVEDMVAVEIYNRSLYISYGGWIMIPETKYTVSTTQVTIDKAVLDKNTSMARVSYYYLYCPGDVVTTPLYYIRVVETVETEYSTYDRGVEGVKVDIKRYVNTTGIYVSVAQLLTDANGYCNVYLIPGTLYKVLVSKLLYYDALSDYIPAPANQFGQTTEKVFRISLNETTVAPGDVDYLFKNIVWSIEPTGIRHPGAFTMWFNITSSDSKLEWYSMQIFYWNTTTYSWVSIFYQNDSNAGGGSISFTIPNVTGKYAVKCYFKKTGFPVQELGETGSLIHFIQYFQQWMHGIPDYAYYIVLLFIMVVAMGFFFMYFGTGISTGYIGIIIFAIGLFIHPVTINGISGWIIFAITFIMYTIGIFLWSRI